MFTHFICAGIVSLQRQTLAKTDTFGRTLTRRQAENRFSKRKTICIALIDLLIQFSYLRVSILAGCRTQPEKISFSTTILRIFHFLNQISLEYKVSPSIWKKPNIDSIRFWRRNAATRLIFVERARNLTVIFEKITQQVQLTCMLALPFIWVVLIIMHLHDQPTIGSRTTWQYCELNLFEFISIVDSVIYLRNVALVHVQRMRAARWSLVRGICCELASRRSVFEQIYNRFTQFVVANRCTYRMSWPKGHELLCSCSLWKSHTHTHTDTHAPSQCIECSKEVDSISRFENYEQSRKPTETDPPETERTAWIFVLFTDPCASSGRTSATLVTCIYITFRPIGTALKLYMGHMRERRTINPFQFAFGVGVSVKRALVRVWHTMVAWLWVCLCAVRPK